MASSKLCFVTVGATASFKPLLCSVLDDGFLSTLHELGYTDLLVQYGLDGRQVFQNFVTEHPSGSDAAHGVRVNGFDFKKTGLVHDMRLSKEDPSENRSWGVVISHAGMKKKLPSFDRDLFC